MTTPNGGERVKYKLCVFVVCTQSSAQKVSLFLRFSAIILETFDTMSCYERVNMILILISDAISDSNS